MEGTITKQLGAMNFGVEAGGGLVKRHTNHLVKLPLRLAEEETPDVQVDNTANYPGIPVNPEIPEEIIEVKSIHMDVAAAAPVVTDISNSYVRMHTLTTSQIEQLCLVPSKIGGILDIEQD